MIWPTLLAAVISCVAITLAWFQLETVTRMPSRGLRALLPRLVRTPEVDRVMVAALDTDAATWEGKLARELASAEDESNRVDAASEAVSELAMRYGARSRWAWSALRLQILGGVLAASLAVAEQERAAATLALLIAASGAEQERAAATLALLIAASGAIIVHMLGRAAAEREKEQRSNADKLVGLLLPSVHNEERRARSAHRTRHPAPNEAHGHRRRL